MRCVRVLLVLVILTLIVTGCDSRTLPAGSTSPDTVTLKLSRGDFPVLVYNPKGKLKGTVVFGSGDGGWKIWEERACRSLALEGWCVIGWDCREYASDQFPAYDAVILGKDLQTMASAGIGSRTRGNFLIYGGYSTGAEQSVAGVAWILSQRVVTETLPTGLLLVAPGQRGRYGITDSDLLGITPQGSGSFAIADLALNLGDLAVVQIHGTFDPLDSTEWLGSSSSHHGPHRVFEINGEGHFFGDADANLQETLCQAVKWLVSQPAPINPKTR